MAGCATKPQLDEHIKSELGTIGVAGYQFPPNTVSIPNSPGKVQGTIDGAAGGAGGVLVAGLYSYDPYAFLLSVLLVPVFAVGGAVYGAITTDSPLPADMVAINQNQIDAAFTELKIQDSLRDRVEHLAQAKTNHKIVLLPEEGPSDQNSTYDYRQLTNKGIDTVLEAGFSYIETTPVSLGKTGLIINADARLINVSNNTNIFYTQYQFRSSAYSLADWATNDARLVQETFDKATNKMARDILKDFLVIKKNATKPNAPISSVYDAF